MLRTAFVIIMTSAAILIAGWLALRRADIPYHTLEAAYMLPDSQFMTLDEGLKIHYTDTGSRDRSALVLIHGFSSSLHSWDAWRADLETDYRVITFDLPGHGLSRAEAAELANIGRFSEIIHEVTRRLGIERFTLAGHSMGGHTALQYALTHPDVLEGLILVDASGWPETEEERGSEALIFSLLRHRLARTLIRDLDMTFLARGGLRDSYTDQTFVTDALIERYVSMSRAPGHRDTLLAIGSERQTDLTAAELAELDLPALILWGRDDKLTPVTQGEAFAEAMSDARLVIYEGVGHMPQEEAAEETIAEVRTFMDRVEWQALDEEAIIPAGDPRLGAQ